MAADLNENKRTLTVVQYKIILRKESKDKSSEEGNNYQLFMWAFGYFSQNSSPILSYWAHTYFMCVCSLEKLISTVLFLARGAHCSVAHTKHRYSIPKTRSHCAGSGSGSSGNGSSDAARCVAQRLGASAVQTEAPHKRTSHRWREHGVHRPREPAPLRSAALALASGRAGAGGPALSTGCPNSGARANGACVGGRALFGTGRKYLHSYEYCVCAQPVRISLELLNMYFNFNDEHKRK